MKSKFLQGLVIGLILIGMSGIAHALSLSFAEVGGSIDKLKFSTDLGKSDEKVELAWVNEVLGGGYEYVVDKYDVTETEWLEISDYEDNIFAHTLDGAPDYFLIKIGNKSENSFTHFLFKNFASADWGVINLADMGFNDKNILNISKVSHIGEFGGALVPVPEPGTMLLMGTGLAGLAGGAARRRNKK